MQSKHPHVIYEYADKSPQGCAVSPNYNRKKRNTLDAFEDLIRVKKDVRAVQKFIELALVVDKAMFELRENSPRKIVIQDAIQVANIADLVSFSIRLH